MNAVFTRPRPTTGELLNAIHLPQEGLWAGWELTSALERSPWVWVRIASLVNNHPRDQRAECGEAVRLMTSEEVSAVTKLQQRGYIVCRVVYMKRGNRFARASID